MTLLSWPPTLPQAPKINGFQKKKVSNIVTTTTAQGLKRRRKRFTGTPKEFIVTLPPLTTEELEIFEEFHDVLGTEYFTWRDFTKDPIVSADYCFGSDMPVITPHTGALWAVSFTLEMR